MHKYCLLIYLQIKSAFRKIPKLMLFGLLFVFIIFLLGIAGIKVTENQNNQKKINIAYVLPSGEDTTTSMAFSFLSEIDTIKKVCNFIPMEREEALKQLENKKIYAVILVPDKFISHIIDGTNTPATILLPEYDSKYQSNFFKALVQAGADDIAAAQAGIYAVDDLLLSSNNRANLSKSEELLNNEYFSYALERSIYFHEQGTASGKFLTVPLFYLCSGIVLLLLLWGIPCAHFLSSHSRSLHHQLGREGISASALTFSKVGGISIVFYCILLFCYLTAEILSIRFSGLKDFLFHPSPKAFLGLLVLVICIYSMIAFLYFVARQVTTGIILVFSVGSIMIFVSGGFFPLSMLPGFWSHLSNFLPSTYNLELCREIITESVSVRTLSANMAFIFFFGILTCIIGRLRTYKI